MARYAGPRAKALFYLAVMLPLWSSYLVRVYAWKLILAKEGIVSWLFDATGIDWPARRRPGAAGDRRAVAVGLLPRHVPRLHLYLAALHDPADRGGAGARAGLAASRPRPISAPGRGTTFRKVILPLAFPGVVAGSIFTFSLTLGDYIIPYIVGTSQPVHRPGRLPAAGHRRQHPAGRRLLGRADRDHGRLPDLAKRLGAFDAL